MPASDPTFGVPTPAGTLQGVAAFSWDGAAWQPAGRAGPDVATPTGVLRGVAPFSWDGAAWQPVGRAQPGVATPSGVLDGVAVYNWSGSAWTPPGGTPTPSTPSGSLQGVAAFNWDGSAWQPAGQAGPEVATPYGVLTGVAMFNWTGTAWAAVQGPSLDLSFMNPGVLDPRVTFTRASTATYFDATGTLQSAAANAPRWDYDPVTHALRGLLIEEARTNSVRNGNATGAVPGTPGTPPTNWALNNVNAGIATSVVGSGTESGIPYVDVRYFGTMNALGNCAVAIPEPAGAIAGAAAQVWTVSGYWRLVAGTLGANNGAQTFWTETGGASGAGGAALAYPTSAGLATQRFAATRTLSTGTTAFSTQVYMSATNGTVIDMTIRWGGLQVEQGAFPTSYIPTTAAAVTRAVDTANVPVGAWYSTAASSLFAESILPNPAAAVFYQTMASLDDGTTTNRAQLYRGASSNGIYVQANGYGQTPGAMTPGQVFKIAVAYQNGAQAGAFNGVLGISDVQAGMPVGVTTLRIGYTANGLGMTGYIRRVRYWPRVLSAAELQAATQ